MLKLVLDMTPAEIEQFLQDKFDELDNQTLEQFKLVLAEALKIQRAKIRPEGYNDITGQLRSSTGGIIFRDGKVLHEDFELSPYGTDKAPGLKEGREKAFAELRESKGWGITIVAGMEYASWVQDRKFSVLRHANHELEATLEEAFNRISV